MKILLGVISASDENLIKNKTTLSRLLNFRILSSFSQDPVSILIYSYYEDFLLNVTWILPGTSWEQAFWILIQDIVDHNQDLAEKAQ